jgi:HAD superfamily hydrolase (TIGR01509 family)
MFAGTVLDQAMLELFRKLHAKGVPTGLLSNSWGGLDYPREMFPERFDAVVISGEVGMRKPEQRIFLHAAELLELEPHECVFIDDIEANISAAVELGFTGVLHHDTATTVRRVSELLGIDL